MASLKLVKSAVKARPMWLYPQVVGFNPSERWGHSACFAEGILYVFGGCCGGLHFSDVLTLDSKKMAWSSLVTTGQQPGTRDSHSAVLVGQKMIVFGGTNGFKKINDLHILDLKTRDWTRPLVEGRPPAPRESHSATLLDDNKLVIFGGSGEGEGNYMNDVHILDLDSMKWTSPAVKGELPARRDSHTAVAIGNKLVVYGGDCGDHYLGEVDVLDLGTFTWSRMKTEAAASPGVRAGHASIVIGNKVYILGGVGDRAYYNDVWTLDLSTHAWTQLDVAGPQPQGRFSHSAVRADSNIVIYGGCGEDEHPLDEIILLHLGSDFKNGSAFSLCHFLANPYSREHRRFSGCRRVSEGMQEERMAHASDPKNETSGRSHKVSMPFERITATGGRHWRDDIDHNIKSNSEIEEELKTPSINPDDGATKRRKVLDFRNLELESEQEEHSHSLSEQSSPSQSDQEQTVQKKSKLASSNSTQPETLSLQRKPRNVENQLNQRTHPYTHNFSLYPHNFNFGDSKMKLEFQQPQEQQQKLENVLPAPSLQLKMCLPHLPPSLPVHGCLQTPQVQFPARDHNADVPDPASRNSRHGRVESQAIGDEQQRVTMAGIVAVPNLVGSEVRGIVDAVFDSGYLMSAQVNGQIFRGMLFSPSPALSVRDEHMFTACKAPVNSHPGPGFVASHIPRISSQSHSVQYYPGSMNGTILGSPVTPNTHLGTAVQPTNWNPPKRVTPASDNRTEGAGSRLGLMLKSPCQNSTEVPKKYMGIPSSQRQCIDGPSKVRLSVRGGGDEVHSSPHSRVRSTVNSGLEGLGHAVPVFGGSGGHWVWYPLHHPAAPTEIIPVEEHSANACNDNVHFVAVQDFSGFGFSHQRNRGMEASIVQDGSVHASSNTTKGAVPDLQVGVTLSLGGPGQTPHSHVTGQKN